MENFELTECIYECIKDTYYYGVFGDFKLVIDQATGCFNATKLCDVANKRFHDWNRLEKSKRMVEYYRKSWGGDNRLSFMYEVKLQNNDPLNKQVTGTYVPKELILDIASWISIEFYDRCNSIIINYFIKEFKKMDKKKLKEKIKEVEDQMEKLTIESQAKDVVIQQKDDKIDELKQLILRQDQEREKDRKYMRSRFDNIQDQNEELLEKNEELLDHNKGLEKRVVKVQRKLGIAVEDRAPLPEDKRKQERFVLLKTNDPDYWPYYTIRSQDSYATRKLKEKKEEFPKMKVLLDLKCNPNSKTLYNRIKEQLKADDVHFKGNSIDLSYSHISEKQLLKEMMVINDSKRDV